jgi:hypothetical protein
MEQLPRPGIQLLIVNVLLDSRFRGNDEK